MRTETKYEQTFRLSQSPPHCLEVVAELSIMAELQNQVDIVAVLKVIVQLQQKTAEDGTCMLSHSQSEQKISDITKWTADLQNGGVLEPAVNLNLISDS